MCRYSDPLYKTHYVCLDCRVSKKSHYGARCSLCGAAMTPAGKDFAAPKKADKKAWEAVVIILSAAPNAYNSCGCGGPGYRPTSPKEARIWADEVIARRRRREIRHNIDNNIMPVSA